MSTLLETADTGTLQTKTSEIIGTMIEKDCDLYEASGLKPENIEALYGVGHSFYMAGSYAEAETIFSTLCLYNTRNKRNWLALGGAAQAQRNYNGALIAYSIAQVLDLMDPEPVVRTYECHLEAGNFESALENIETLLNMTKGRPGMTEIHHQAELLLNEIKSSLV
jgi:type III secretion system low calcium response chaperone LcrH/SycD